MGQTFALQPPPTPSSGSAIGGKGQLSRGRGISKGGEGRRSQKGEFERNVVIKADQDLEIWDRLS